VGLQQLLIYLLQRSIFISDILCLPELIIVLLKGLSLRQTF